MNWKLLLGLMLVMMIVGCGENATTTIDDANDDVETETTADPLAGLMAAPESYCVTYSTTMPNAPKAPGESLDSEMEYCKDQANSALFINAFGSKIDNFCVNGKGSSCYREGTSATCMEDESICGSLHDPFGQMNLDEYDARFYQKSTQRQFAGITGKCFRVDMVEVGKATNQDTSNIPEQVRYLDFCYHPQFKYLLYYSFMGSVTEVKSFVTPAPAGKLVLPAAVVQG